MSECIDASVAVKWFKKEEEYADKAMIVYEKIRDFKIQAVMSEWIGLEIVRALMKSNYSKEKINDAFFVIHDLFSIGRIEKILVSDIILLAKNIEIDLKLYAADSVHLASAIYSNSKILWTEDKHLLNERVKKYVSKYNLELKKLVELK